MKKLMLSALAMTMLAGPLAATAAEAHAYPQQTVTTVQENRHGREVVTERTVVRPGYRTWHRGERFDYRYAPAYRRVTEYRTYRLPPPPPRHYWARSGHDAILCFRTARSSTSAPARFADTLAFAP